MKLIFNCEGIGCEYKHEVNVDLPGWTYRLEDFGHDIGGDGSWFFCPSCKDQAEWFDAVCPGCVEGFPGCEFSRIIERGISPAQLRIVRSGRCPGRTNGTMSYCRSSGMQSIDLSSKAPVGGIAVADAIVRNRAKE